MFYKYSPCLWTCFHYEGLDLDLFYVYSLIITHCLFQLWFSCPYFCGFFLKHQCRELCIHVAFGSISEPKSQFSPPIALYKVWIISWALCFSIKTNSFSTSLSCFVFNGEKCPDNNVFFLFRKKTSFKVAPVSKRTKLLSASFGSL